MNSLVPRSDGALFPVSCEWSGSTDRTESTQRSYTEEVRSRSIATKDTLHYVS
jgi:hypothetical protein